ncbi:MAG TPA: serine hydrolase domain-containing protein [Alphaproteobacteria bacterium]|nr:serine hydrolase domain-containing protein [Alphaproteobacteria bacterium]
MAAGYSAVVDAEGNLEGEASRAVVPWWSFTKTLIAACALRLAEDGRLSLDVPVADGPYTLRALLQHRAGVGNYGSLPEYHEAVARGDEPWTDAELLARVPADRLLFAPGTGWAYSNVGYFVVRRVIEKTCGAGLAEVLDAVVLAPLGLRGSRLAVTRADMGMTVFEGGQDYHPGWVFHGTVIGPVAEAALALHRILGGHLITPACRAALLDRHPIGGPVAGRPWLTTGYGLGLMMGTMQRPGMTGPLEVAGHSAGGPGSVGAVYHGVSDGRGRTAAVFAAGSDEGIAEDQALKMLIAT